MESQSEENLSVPPPVSSVPDPRPPEPAVDLLPPEGAFGELNELLKRPVALVRRARDGGPVPVRLLLGALVCFALYGVAAGCFTGGAGLWLAAFKVPLIIALTFVLCLPSLYVFGAMAGADWTGRRFWTVISGFAGTLGLLLVALLPISWLFSVSSRYLASAVWLHFFLWILALAFGWRFLNVALRESGSRSGLALWLVLFLFVSLQVATVLRPVIVRDKGDALFVQGKMFFLEHLGRIYDRDEKMAQAERDARAKAEEAAKAKAEREAKAREQARAKPGPKPRPAGSGQGGNQR